MHVMQMVTLLLIISNKFVAILVNPKIELATYKSVKFWL